VPHPIEGWWQSAEEISGPQRPAGKHVGDRVRDDTERGRRLFVAGEGAQREHLEVDFRIT